MSAKEKTLTNVAFLLSDITEERWKREDKSILYDMIHGSYPDITEMQICAGICAILVAKNLKTVDPVLGVISTMSNLIEEWERV